MGVGRPQKYNPTKYYRDFKRRFPNFEKSVVHWEPHKAIPDWIELYLIGGEIFIYSFVQQTVWSTKKRWK